MLRLTGAGYPEVTVSVRGGPGACIEVRAAGREDTPGGSHDGNAPDPIEEEINRNILSRYANRIDYRYLRGVNRYRVRLRHRDSPDLSREIFDFYSTATEKDRAHPLSVLFRLAGLHRGRIALSMAVKSLKHVAALMLPVFAANIIDTVVTGGAFFVWPVFFNIVASFAALAVNLVCFWLDRLIYHRFVRAAESGFKLALVQKLEALSMRYHNNAQSGTLLSKLISDVQFITMLIYERLTDLLHLCIDICFVVVAALTRFPPMLLFYAVIIPAATLLIRRFARPVLESKAAMRRKTEGSNAAFKEMLEMTQLTRSHGLQKTEYRKVSERVRQVQEAANLYDRIGVWVNNVSYGGAQGFKLICLCFAAFLFSRGLISVGTVVLFQSIFEMIINSVQRVLDELPQITQGYDSLVSVNEILFEQDTEPNGSARLPEPVRGEIEFRDVTFSYAQDREPVLRGVSFRVPAGRSVAFIGRSGSGKTTLLNLLLGLDTVQNGRILIDGADLDKLDKNVYRRHVAVISQNTVLFSGTLWDNLVYGLDYVTPDEVRDVLTRVGLGSLVESLPDGLDSQVLEGGVNFSGGQRQRIAIARALLRRARIILFDEATSALDTESEQQVQDAIDAVMHQCTVVMVAHRLNTLRKADEIYRIADGRIVLCDSLDQAILEMGAEGPEASGAKRS